ncbi:MAG: hemerythrin family protein [Rhodospirillaceae bacterium]|nr:hemerythrin family protein [Rhodospirillaceae bacterium]MCA8932420.1 hemerythrin family protein [Rhodospirillaceae bacterium]
MASWSADLELGNPSMDDDHKQLVMLVNELEYSVDHRRSSDVIRAQFEDLMTVADRHFCHEERMMRQAGYPDFRGHKKLHDDLTRDLHTLMRQIASGEGEVSHTTIEWLKGWVGGHIRGEDRKLAKFLAERPLLSRIA